VSDPTEFTSPAVDTAATIGGGPDDDRNYFQRVWDAVDKTNAIVLPFLAFLSALIIGVFVIVLSDVDQLREGDWAGIFSTVVDAYTALFEGAFLSLRGFNETLVSTAPLLLAGLSVSLAFKAGMFNIGATGQLLFGGMAAVWVGFSMEGPGIIQVPLGVLAGMLGGALYGFIPGVLKARSGVHEVISTIMLNAIALSFVLWLLKTDTFRREGRQDPISKLVNDEGRLPKLFGFLDRPELRAHLGIVIAILACIFFWWLLERTTLGFEIRAQGANSSAARYAGMKPQTLIMVTFLIAGGFAGLAGASEVLGTEGRATQSLAGDLGFDAIAVALLGRSTPLGTALAAFLFGALNAGGQKMQVETGIPVDLVLILRALIVLFIAAPELMRLVWRVKAEGAAQAPSLGGWG